MVVLDALAFNTASQQASQALTELEAYWRNVSEGSAKNIFVPVSARASTMHVARKLELTVRSHSKKTSETVHRHDLAGVRASGRRQRRRVAAAAARADGQEERKERVVGAEDAPQVVVDAERRSAPLRRWRLATYALAASAAAAQAATVFEAAEGALSSPTLWVDVAVVGTSAGLWRRELRERAENIARIVKEAESRAEQLASADRGEGETLWAARVRRMKR